MQKICHAVPEKDFSLRLAFSDGTTTVVDFKPVIKRGGIFAPLADPAFFEKVALDEHGRYIAWPGDLDFCADALWEEGRLPVPGARSEMVEQARGGAARD